MSSYRKNTWIVLALAFIRFFRTSIRAIRALIAGSSFHGQSFPALDRIFSDGPDSFTKKPTAIRAGRSIFTFLLSFFHYVPEKK